MAIEKDDLIQKTFRLLEYEKIMGKAASYAASEEAAEIIRNERPLADAGQDAGQDARHDAGHDAGHLALRLEKVKNAVKAIIGRSDSGDPEPRMNMPSIGFLFPKLETQGMILELDEAYAIGLFVEQGCALKKWLGKTEALLEYTEAVPDCEKTAAEIFKIINKDGQLRDLPCFRAIKKRIQSLNSQLEAVISRYTADEDSRRMLQSFVPSQRDGRTVLAVKANYRSRITGIVHEVSTSGQTVFIEPAEVVEKNNDILIERRNLDAEVRRVLRELTESVSQQSGTLRQFHHAVLALECLRAKARYAQHTKGQFARHSETGGIALVRARHPLLAKPVPIDFAMESMALIITGPNTGGKTVALKTAGLFALMNQSGLALPADEGTSLPVFDGVYADIGDEQSIGQSLSTFSAHIHNIAGIIAHATAKSLVLLDELGAGTDPQEGSAIAMAILDHLIEKKSRLIISTHHGVLKNYGYSRPGVENASVEFNLATLSPTYRIITGIPGESRALDIAGKNGLPARIIENARAYLADGLSDVSALISGLKEKHRLLDEAAIKNREEGQKLKDDIRRSDLKELRLKQKEIELKQGLAGKLRLLLDESRKTLENLVREVREGDLDRDKTKRVKDFLESLERTVQAENAALEEEENALATAMRHAQETRADGRIEAGMEVFAGKTRRRGTVIRADKKNRSGNTWIVEIGAMKISFSEKDLAPVPPEQSGSNYHSLGGQVGWALDLAGTSNFQLELNLRGMRLEDALAALRRQIDAAAISGVKEFSVVHGKGDGILQKGVHDFLKGNPAIADYYFSRPEFGGFGRTEVVLK